MTTWHANEQIWPYGHSKLPKNTRILFRNYYLKQTQLNFIYIADYTQRLPPNAFLAQKENKSKTKEVDKHRREKGNESENKIKKLYKFEIL